MRKFYFALFGYLLGTIGFFFVPSSFKFFTFIIPLIFLCVALSSQRDYFNINLFIVLLFVFLIIPSSLITFDASRTIEFTAYTDTVSTIIDNVSIVIFVGIPIFMVTGVIWSFISGNISDATKTLTTLVMFMGFSMILFFAFNAGGLELGGMTRWVSAFYSNLISFVVNSPLQIYEGINAFFVNTPLAGLKLPPIPSKYENQDISFDAMYDSLKTMSYRDVIFTIHDSLPLLISVMCLFVAIFTFRQKWEDGLTDLLNKVSEPRKLEEKERFFPAFNFPMAFYLLILIVSAFIIFLGYKYSFGQDPARDYQYIGYFGLYLIMAVVPLAIMLLTPFPFYKHATIKNTIMGTFLGVIALFLMQRLFFAKTVYSAYSIQDIEPSIIYIANTFTFIAPAETILFHIFWPALVAGAIKTYTKNKLETFDKQGQFPKSKAATLLDIDNDIAIEKRLESYYKKSSLTNKEKLMLAFTETRLSALEQERQDVLGLPDDIDVNLRSIFGRSKSLFLFVIFGVIAANVVFSSMHFIVLSFTTDVDFFTFWLSGLGVIYFAGGCWFTFISFRYGWLAGIFTHAAYNSSTDLFIILFLGV